MVDTKVYTLLKVYECGSFVAAAKQLCITQPAVSQHIKALEDELNVRLFERNTGKLVVTKQGEEVRQQTDADTPDRGRDTHGGEQSDCRGAC